jgi:hypothetical protein
MPCINNEGPRLLIGALLGGGGGDKWCGRPGRQSPKVGEVGRKMNILNEAKLIFCTRETLNY